MSAPIKRDSFTPPILQPTEPQKQEGTIGLDRPPETTTQPKPRKIVSDSVRAERSIPLKGEAADSRIRLEKPPKAKASIGQKVSNFVTLVFTTKLSRSEKITASSFLKEERELMAAQREYLANSRNLNKAEKEVFKLKKQLISLKAELEKDRQAAEDSPKDGTIKSRFSETQQQVREVTAQYVSARDTASQLKVPYETSKRVFEELHTSFTQNQKFSDLGEEQMRV